MEAKTIEIPYTYRNEVKIHTIGDIHAGIKHCAEAKIRAKIREVRDDSNAYWIGMGDYGEFITQSDPRWDTGVIVDWLKDDRDNIAFALVDWIVELFKPIKHKCLGLLEGNHEDSIRIHNHDDVQKEICKRLEVDNLGYTCMINFSFKRQNSTETHVIKGAFSHGAGCAVTKGTKMNRLERFMNIFPTARIVAIGHMHDKINHELPYLDIDENGKVFDSVRVGAITGSWFKTYEQGVRASYGEKKGYPPCVLGAPAFHIKPSHNLVWVE